MSRIKEGPAGYELRYRSGQYSAAEWFFMCLTSGRSFFDGPNFKEFAERARVRINEIEYPVRVGFGSAGMQYDWNSLDDVYAFANDFTGDMFEFGAWLKQYVSERSEGGRERLFSEAESKREQMKKEREQIDAVKADNPKASLREIEAQTGIDKDTVRNRLSKNSSIDEKLDRPTHSQRTSARQVYLPLDPQAAARRLVEKFGREFVGKLVDALEM